MSKCLKQRVVISLPLEVIWSSDELDGMDGVIMQNIEVYKSGKQHPNYEMAKAGLQALVATGLEGFLSSSIQIAVTDKLQEEEALEELAFLGNVISEDIHVRVSLGEYVDE